MNSVFGNKNKFKFKSLGFYYIKNSDELNFN